MEPDHDLNSEKNTFEDTSTESESEYSTMEIQEIERAMSELLNFLGKKHTLTIQRHFVYGDGPLRFTDLEEAIDIAPNTLSKRLKEFTDADLLTRNAYNEIPPRVEYEMTDKSRDLKPLFETLYEWMEHHNFDRPPSDDDVP